MSTSSVQEWLESEFLGRPIAVQKGDHDWCLSFGEGLTMTVTCMWRLVSPEALRITSGDHLQQFGRPIPVDASSELTDLLAGATIEKVRLSEATADVFLAFSNALELQIINDSAGYEGWQIVSLRDGVQSQVIGLGGGGFG